MRTYVCMCVCACVCVRVCVVILISQKLKLSGIQLQSTAVWSADLIIHIRLQVLHSRSEPYVWIAIPPVQPWCITFGGREGEGPRVHRMPLK